MNLVLLYFTLQFYVQTHTLGYTEVSDTTFKLIIPLFRIMVIIIL